MRKKVSVSLCLAFALGACGGGDSPTITPTPTPPSKAVINVLFDPNPIIAVPSGDSDYPWAFRVNLQLSESGGVGFIVVSMQTSVTAASTGQVFATSDQNVFVGQKIPALGQNTVQYYMYSYRMDWAKTKEGAFNVKMNFLDDRGNTSAYDGIVQIRRTGHDIPDLGE